jgi:hypothetical protein
MEAIKRKLSRVVYGFKRKLSRDVYRLLLNGGSFCLIAPFNNNLYTTLESFHLIASI